MRPDRLVVGEVRGPEVVELLASLNTGHDGGAGTLHANSPAEVPARFEALAALGGLTRAALHSQLAAAIHLVLFMRREGNIRRLAEIGIVERTDTLVKVTPAWRPGERLYARTTLESLLAARNIPIPWPPT
jgi:pilus assembly protein CpaF